MKCEESERLHFVSFFITLGFCDEGNIELFKCFTGIKLSSKLYCGEQVFKCMRELHDL